MTTASSSSAFVEADDVDAVELVRSRERLYSMYLVLVSMNSLAASARASSDAPFVVSVLTLRRNDRPQFEHLPPRGVASASRRAWPRKESRGWTNSVFFPRGPCRDAATPQQSQRRFCADREREGAQHSTTRPCLGSRKQPAKTRTSLSSAAISNLEVYESLIEKERLGTRWPETVVRCDDDESGGGGGLRTGLEWTQGSGELGLGWVRYGCPSPGRWRLESEGSRIAEPSKDRDRGRVDSEDDDADAQGERVMVAWVGRADEGHWYSREGDS